MKLVPAIVMIAVMGTSIANAQTSGSQGGAVGGAAAGAVGGAIVGGPIGAVIGAGAGAVAGGALGSMTQDDRVYVQKYVYDKRVEPVTVKERLVIGKPLPGTVKTYTFDGNARMSAYRYAYVNNQYLLLDKSGNIVGAIEK